LKTTAEQEETKVDADVSKKNLNTKKSTEGGRRLDS